MLVTRRRLRREVAEMGRAYRRSIAEAELGLRRAERELAEYVSLLGRPRGVAHERGKVVVVLEFTEKLVESQAPERLRRLIMEEVLGRLAQIVSKDPRGDLRETDEQRRRRRTLLG